MAVDYFLKIDGVPGESKAKGNENEIQVESWSFGASNAGSSGYGTGASTGKVSFNDFHFTMPNSKSSHLMLHKCATGEHIKDATLTCRLSTGEGGQKPFLLIKFEDIVISSFQVGGTPGDSSGRPHEQISFNFTKITWDQKKQGDKGSMENAGEFKYDVKGIGKY